MHRPFRTALAVLGALTALATACTDDDTSATERGDEPLVLSALSTRAEYVTGGDVLVELEGDDTASATLTVDGEPVDAAVRTDRAGRTVALVEGLPEGDSEIVATAGGATATLTVTNHDISGPLFSGEQLPMPVCTTDRYGLDPSTPEDGCFAEPVTTWQYRTDDGDVVDLEDPTAVPADAATISEGPHAGRPLVTRTERGVRNRGIYEITVLDPEPDPDAPWDPANGNGRLVYRFGGGCGVTYTQGFLLLGDPETALLSQGYAFATSTLNTFQVACNETVSAETALMVKEHFAETYDAPELTIGNGGSGGAIQQYLVAQNYPGILDAVTSVVPFPDAVSIAPGVVDCILLNRYYTTPAGQSLSPEQRTAINGHATPLTCTTWQTTFGQNLQPDGGCSLAILDAAAAAADGGRRRGLSGVPAGGLPELPADQAWSPENPDGLRCTLQDGNVTKLGRDPETGYANRPLDNTGVQYGLTALNDGLISVEEFLDLNRDIGGADIDGRPVPDRMDVEEATIEAAYASGAVVQGGALLDVPVIAVDVYTDDQGDIHDRFRAFSLRDRLEAAAGGEAPNYVIWTRAVPEGKSLVDSLTGSLSLDDLVPLADEWATAAAADDGGGSRMEVLARTRPEAAGDNCIDPDGERITGDDVYGGPGPCTDAFPTFGDPRTAAGAPRANDVLKCALQPVAEAIDAGRYAPELTDGQRAALEEVFPQGVCDHTRPGIGTTAPDGDWQRY